MYKILFAEVVRKQQRNIPGKDFEKIKRVIVDLQTNPRPVACKKLVGGANEYRVRYGYWRVLYSIDDKNKTVVVYGILHRKEAYR